MKSILFITLLAVQINLAQNSFPVGTLQITNDGVYNSLINSGNVARMDMGYDGAKGYVKFGAHTGNGHRDNILYMRGSDGNIGIGTTNPRANLDVANNISNGQLGTVFGRLPEGDNSGLGTYLGVKGYSTYGTDINNIKSFSIVHDFYGQTNSSINFYRGGNSLGGFITFNTSDNTEKMRIGTNGNVGIGTINPTSKLTVAGDINSREVKVTVNAGADFVFADEYDLPSLESLDKYVKENKHLPEIASAKEMETNGINLSEMNIKLLQKVEELTLYIIEQNKISNELIKKVTKLESAQEK